jgi:hypothetical protein
METGSRGIEMFVIKRKARRREKKYPTRERAREFPGEVASWSMCVSRALFFSSIFRSPTPRDPAAARRNRPYDWRGRLLAFLLALPVFLLLEAIKAASKEL